MDAVPFQCHRMIFRLLAGRSRPVTLRDVVGSRRAVTSYASMNIRTLSSSSTLRADAKKLTSVEEIEEFISIPRWKVDMLLPDSTVDSSHEEINSESLRQLLTRSGLQFPKTIHDEEKLLKDLKRQLVFVDHVGDIDTIGINPLNRVGVIGQELQWEDVQLEGGDYDEWDVLQSASRTERGFFVLDETLKQEET
ncbi:hypothetical protein V1511DRAFT_491170 [Dipodascopsis uninucleata]